MNNTLAKSVFSRPSAAVHGTRDQERHHEQKPLATRLQDWLLKMVARVIRRPPPPLNLELTDRFVRFRGMQEFEFSLVSRAEFPATRVRDLMTRSPQELEAAAATIRDAERHFSSVLARSVKEPG